jgi:hypothetical protein
MLALALAVSLLRAVLISQDPPHNEQQAQIILASVHVGSRGPGHLSRTGTAASASGCTAGQLDFSCAANSALISVL